MNRHLRVAQFWRFVLYHTKTPTGRVLGINYRTKAVLWEWSVERRSAVTGNLNYRTSGVVFELSRFNREHLQ